MKPGGRVVTVGSTASFQLKFANPALKKRAMDDKLGLEDLEQLFQEYKAASSKPEDDDGWNRAGYAPAYSASKGFMNLATAALAREHPELIINVGCPGICETAEIPKGVNWVLKTTDEGCRLPLRLAFDDLDGVNGQFWAGKSTADKGPGVGKQYGNTA
ncbi:hypothetical protein BCR39DRAFT_344039 [Naematelia encephala]|uniref:Uncharacterized protein n=1 Tax=Naematelia encephala TaxID=71784 RepID=A0A1Y2AM77_9TREE|nr:hypothetical protein BCR39DRAFT_344039 [Naematelia encephala]